VATLSLNQGTCETTHKTIFLFQNLPEGEDKKAPIMQFREILMKEVEDDKYSPWDTIPAIMSESLRIEPNEIAFIGHFYHFYTLAQNPVKVQEWLGNEDFITALPIVLNDLYKRRVQFAKKEVYERWRGNSKSESVPVSPDAHCEAGLKYIELIINIMEFLYKESVLKSTYNYDPSQNSRKFVETHRQFYKETLGK